MTRQKWMGWVGLLGLTMFAPLQAQQTSENPNRKRTDTVLILPSGPMRPTDLGRPWPDRDPVRQSRELWRWTEPEHSDPPGRRFTLKRF
ncbi:MAG: hypothetical protein SFU56_00090 [Capsulimonadales bacterium]|nr:hypothetical protein [Capsulimonadales bacterium]